MAWFVLYTGLFEPLKITDMNNYRDEYGIPDMDAEAQETLELMHEKLDTDCGDAEPMGGNDTDKTSAGRDTGAENIRDGKAHAGKCR